MIKQYGPCPDCEEPLPYGLNCPCGFVHTNQIDVDVYGDHIAIHDCRAELIYWTEQEWIDDPDLTMEIATIIHMGHTVGAKLLRTYLNYPERYYLEK